MRILQFDTDALVYVHKTGRTRDLTLPCSFRQLKVTRQAYKENFNIIVDLISRWAITAHIQVKLNTLLRTSSTILI